MTRLTNSPLIRETAAAYRGRPLIVELHPAYLSIREKGRREAAPASVDYVALYEFGLKLRAREMQTNEPRRKRSKP